MRELGGEESDNDYTLLENFVLFNELSGWLFNFIEEMEKSDPIKAIKRTMNSNHRYEEQRNEWLRRLPSQPFQISNQ